MSTHPDDPRPVPGGAVPASSGGYDDRQGAPVVADPRRPDPDLRDDAYARTSPDLRGDSWDRERTHELHDRDRDRDRDYDRDRDRDRDRDGHDNDRSSGPSAVEGAVDSLAQPDNRAKLLLAIAVMVGLTLLLTLISLIDQLAERGSEPVLVQGVPCLVEDGPDEQAVLYCQN